MVNGQKRPPGEEKERVLFIPLGYRVVFSIEEQNAGLFLHLSMAVETPGLLPSVAAVLMVMQSFGFAKGLQENVIQLEDIGEDHQAVNVLEKIDDGKIK